jgi:aspartyl-tRNA(Asn)/glutamyl-tRNA(Gln) amidotransferase subunit A
VVGLKPSYGRVSRYGLIAYASSLDQIGTLTKTVDDAELLFSMISGHDVKDSTSVPDSVQSRTGRNVPLRVGIPQEYFIDGVDADVIAGCHRMLRILSNAGYETVPINLIHTKYAVPTYYIVASAEMSSNLARFDGIRYGYRAPEYSNWKDMITQSRTQALGPEVQRRIIFGTYVLSAGYIDAYYKRAQQVRSLIRKDFEDAFSQCDLILSPVAPTPAFKIGEKTSDPLTMYLVDIFSVTANLAGLPGISLPCGFSREGLPLSVQLTGPMFSESLLLQVAGEAERAMGEEISATAE